MIQELVQLSLLDERDGRFGFRDLASARQIAKLLNDGVRLSEIIRAVSEIRKRLPTVGLAGVRLHAGALSDVQVEQPGGRTDKYGQFILAVARDDPDELFSLKFAFVNFDLLRFAVQSLATLRCDPLRSASLRFA